MANIIIMMSRGKEKIVTQGGGWMTEKHGKTQRPDG